MAQGHARGEFHLDQAALSKFVQATGRKKVNSLLRGIANQARLDVPVRSGALGRTIGTTQAVAKGPFKVGGTVYAGGPDAPYAIPVHEGSRPHKIVARQAPMLRFFWEKIGRTVAFTSVNHPGVKPRPFLRNAMRRVISTDPDVKRF